MLALIKNYNGLVEALRARQAALALSDETLDDVAGLTRGHTNKVLGPSRERGIGAATLEAYLMALAIDLVMVENAEKLAQMRPHYDPKKAINVRSGHPIGDVVLSRAMTKLGQKRWAKASKEEHSRITRMGALKRWSSVNT